MRGLGRGCKFAYKNQKIQQDLLILLTRLHMYQIYSKLLKPLSFKEASPLGTRRGPALDPLGSKDAPVASPHFSVTPSGIFWLAPISQPPYFL